MKILENFFKEGKTNKMKIKITMGSGKIIVSEIEVSKDLPEYIREHHRDNMFWNTFIDKSGKEIFVREINIESIEEVKE